MLLLLGLYQCWPLQRLVLHDILHLLQLEAAEVAFRLLGRAALVRRLAEGATADALALVRVERCHARDVPCGRLPRLHRVRLDNVSDL